MAADKVKKFYAGTDGRVYDSKPAIKAVPKKTTDEKLPPKPVKNVEEKKLVKALPNKTMDEKVAPMEVKKKSPENPNVKTIKNDKKVPSSYDRMVLREEKEIKEEKLKKLEEDKKILATPVVPKSNLDKVKAERVREKLLKQEKEELKKAEAR